MTAAAQRAAFTAAQKREADARLEKLRGPGETPIHTRVHVPRSSIHVDPSRNARNFGKPLDPTDPELVALAEDIRERGVIDPLVVTMRGGGYELEDGFRRIAAIDLFAGAVVPVTIVSGSPWTIAAMRVVPNEKRKPFSSAELGFACLKLRDVLLAEGPIHRPIFVAKIAEVVGRSSSYVDTLLRCYDRIKHAPILDAWKRGEINMDEAARFSSFEPEHQSKAWAARGAAARTRTETKPNKPRTRSIKLRSRREVDAAFEDFAEGETVDARALLRWVADRSAPFPKPRTTKKARARRKKR